MLAHGEHVLGSVDEGLRRASCGFCGGCGRTLEDVCGAFSGGVIVIGAALGRANLDEDEWRC